jgi:HEAT repeat protein
VTELLQTAYLFLSYRSFEREFAARLAGDLRNAGVGVWMDALDAGIEVGDDWPRRLEQAIDGCAGLICVLSPDYVESTYCRRELQRADQRGVPLVPLLLQPLGEIKTPIQLEGTQYIDFVRWQDPKLYERQYQRLDAELHRKLSPIFGSPPDREPKYLNALVAKLSGAMGVLEYTELASQVVDLRPRPWLEDEFGYRVLRAGARREPDEQREYPSIAAILAVQPRFALIGAPGAGKSTALRRLARDAALMRRERPRSSPLPLVLNLAEWLPTQDLQAFIAAHWPFASDPSEAIAGGDVSLFLDGLNEMGEAGPGHAAQLRTWLSSPGAARTFVVTCRASEYEGDLALGDLPTVLVKELQPQQIAVFAGRYLRDKSEAFLRHLGLDRDGYGNYDRGLLALARNPYLLRSFIELFNHYDLDLPRNTGKLFDRLTQSLWQRESLRRTRGLVPLEKLRERCARLARSMMDDRKSQQVSIEYAEQKTTHWTQFAWRAAAARPLFHSAMSAGLITVDGVGVRFSHQLVQEYFAALSFIDASQCARMDEVKEQRRSGEWFSEMSTFVALCGLVAQPDDLVRLALGWGAQYAGACLASGVVVSDQLQGEIVAALIAIIRRRPVSGFDEADAAQMLGQIGNVGPEGITALGDLLLQDKYPSRDRAATALSRIGTKAAAVELHRSIGNLPVDDEWFTADAKDDYVIERLADMGVVALPELIDTLEHPRPAVGRGARGSTVRALLRIGSPAVPALLEVLAGGSIGAKAGSAEVLGQMRIVEAVPLLLDAWLRPDPGYSQLHNACRDAFKAIGDAALPGVSVELGSASPARRKIAVEALGGIGTMTTVPYLLTALQDDESAVRFEAGFRLAHIGPAVVPAVLDLLRTAAPVAIAAAAFTLGAIKDARAVPELTKLLSHAEAVVRSFSAYALGRLGDSDVASQLLPLLQDSDPNVAASTASSLGELKSAIAVNPLIRCLDERTEGKLREQAALALEKLGTPPAREAAMRYWREVLSGDFHTFEAGNVLGRMKDRSAVPLLIQASREGPKFARTSYIKALAAIGDRSAVPAIIERLHDRDPAGTDPMHIVATAIEALEQLNAPQAVTPLLQMLSVTERASFEGRISDYAAKALQSIGTPEAVAGAGAHWQEALADADLKIRLLAAEALARLPYPPATRELIAALSDQQATTYYDKRTVSDAAATALELIGSATAHAALTDYWRAELDSERVRGRVLAILGLGRLKCYDAEAQLIARLRDTYTYEDRHVADYAVDVLKTFPTQEARVAVVRYVDRHSQR